MPGKKTMGKKQKTTKKQKVKKNTKTFNNKCIEVVSQKKRQKEEGYIRLQGRFYSIYLQCPKNWTSLLFQTLLSS